MDPPLALFVVATLVLAEALAGSLAAGPLAAGPLEEATPLPPAFATSLTFPFVIASASHIVLAAIVEPSTATAPRDSYRSKIIHSCPCWQNCILGPFE